MRAVIYDAYGGTERLRIDDVPTPSPSAGQVLIKVSATSVNLSDWECLQGSPLYARLGGLRTPACRILGSDIAGTVMELGPGASRFKAGDQVYGDNLGLKGGFAEYAVVPESALALKPKNLTHEHASTIPQAGAIALQGLALAKPDRRILINGAGGGSGAFAIQLAKRARAHVTGVDNASKLEFMQSLGADQVIDYRAQDFTRLGQQWDLVLDLVAQGSVRGYRRALRPGGQYFCVGGSVSALLRVATIGALAGRMTGRRLGVLAVKQGPEHFAELATLCAAGEIDIHIDRTFTLDDAAQALEHVGSGRALGKVVVRVV